MKMGRGFLISLAIAGAAGLPEVSRTARSEYNSAQEPQWRQGR
jgi:hypothetical protein